MKTPTKSTIKKSLIAVAITLFGIGIVKYNKVNTEIVIETNDLRDTLLADSFKLDSLSTDTVLIDTVK